MLRTQKRISFWKVAAGIVVAYVAVVFATLPSGGEFKSLNPRTTAFIEWKRSSGRNDNRQAHFRMSWVPLDQISPYLVKAIISSEDTAFFSHRGFDLGELRKVLAESLENFEFPRGASTITQQLAKNLYLSPSKNPIRKIKEALITMRLEGTLSKRRILELYLNVIELGPMIFGVEAASRHYFGKTAKSLSPYEAAFIAAIIPNPITTYNPKLHPGRVEKRRDAILRRIVG